MNFNEIRWFGRFCADGSDSVMGGSCEIMDTAPMKQFLFEISCNEVSLACWQPPTRCTSASWQVTTICTDNSNNFFSLWSDIHYRLQNCIQCHSVIKFQLTTAANVYIGCYSITTVPVYCIWCVFGWAAAAGTIIDGTVLSCVAHNFGT